MSGRGNRGNGSDSLPPSPVLYKLLGNNTISSLLMDTFLHKLLLNPDRILSDAKVDELMSYDEDTQYTAPEFTLLRQFAASGGHETIAEMVSVAAIQQRRDERQNAQC